MGTLLIAGSRSYKDFNTLKRMVDKNQGKYDYINIISGGAPGVDTLAKEYARYKYGDLFLDRFAEYKADWDKYGKSAGFKRNITMADVCNYTYIFWDLRSPGTKNMIELLRQRNKKFIVYVIPCR